MAPRISERELPARQLACLAASAMAGRNEGAESNQEEN
jgi:hypothetical protein